MSSNSNLNLSEELYKIYLKSPDNLFDSFIEECAKWYEQPAHSFEEMRRRDNKKLRGDIFEEFCVLYLTYIRKYKNVYLLKDLPEEIRLQLSLSKRDMGIDIIVEDNNGEFGAIQCKYRKRDTNKSKTIVTWKALSTFYALCLRTGPWSKYIIITNCDYTTHQGKKTNKDLSICIGTLRNISKEQWLSMCNIKSYTLDSEINIESENITKIQSNKNPNKDELRQLRLLKLA